MTTALRQLLSTRFAQPALAETSALSAAWTPADWAGRLVEITGAASSGRTSLAAHMVAAAQRSGEPTAWLQLPNTTIYPPDLAASGIDLAALLVGLLPDDAALLKGADILLRSGSWGLVVLDTGDRALQVGDGQLGRLLGLCQKHAAALILLTQSVATQGSTAARGTTALGSLVSLRLEVTRPTQAPTGCEATSLQAEAVKDKRRGPGQRLSLPRLWPEDAVWPELAAQPLTAAHLPQRAQVALLSGYR